MLGVLTRTATQKAARSMTWSPSVRVATGTFLALILMSPIVAAEDNRLAAGIQDNSFLMEEACNQEPSVVRHINTFRRLDGNWFCSFTDEWPLVT